MFYCCSFWNSTYKPVSDEVEWHPALHNTVLRANIILSLFFSVLWLSLVSCLFFLNSHLSRSVASTGPVFLFLFSYHQGTASAQSCVALRFSWKQVHNMPFFHAPFVNRFNCSRKPTQLLSGPLGVGSAVRLCVSVTIKEAGFQAFDLNIHPRYWHL